MFFIFSYVYMDILYVFLFLVMFIWIFYMFFIFSYVYMDNPFGKYEIPGTAGIQV